MAVASLSSQGGTPNIYDTYVYIIHVFRGGTESNLTSPGGLASRPPLATGLVRSAAANFLPEIAR